MLLPMGTLTRPGLTARHTCICTMRPPPLLPGTTTLVPHISVQVKVDSIRVTQGASVLYLRVLDGRNSVIPVHIGEAESSSLQKEINKQRQARPLTHDLLKGIVTGATQLRCLFAW